MIFKKLFRAGLLLAIVFLGCLSSNAQNSILLEIDSAIAEAKSDTERIKLNLYKANILGQSNLDSSIALSWEILEQAEKINYYKGIVEARFTLVGKSTFKGNFDETKKQLQYLEKFVKSSDSANIANIYSAYGMMYGVRASYDSSILFYERSIGVNERAGLDKNLKADYANIAIGYSQLANYPKALEFQQRALSLAEKQKDMSLVAKTLLNIAFTYEGIDDTIKSEQSYLKAVDIAAENDFKIIELYAYANLSGLYINRGMWQKSYDYGMKAIAISEATGDLGIGAASLAKTSYAAANLGRFDEAFQLGQRAIRMAESSKQPPNIAQAYSTMGGVYYLQKKYKEAIPYYEKGFEVLKRDVSYEKGVADFYKKLSESYEKTGNYVKALENYKLSAEMTDSLKRKDNIKKATELSMNFEFEKKQEVLAAERKKEEEIHNTRQKTLMTGLALMLVLAGLAFYGYKSKQKANNLLKAQKKQIEDTLTELRNTQMQLIHSEKMASLGELTAGIAHEIQNPLNFVNNFSEMNKELLAEMNEELDKGNLSEAKEIANDVISNEEKINHHGKRAGTIVKGMLQHSRSSSIHKEMTNINALCNEYLQLSYHGLRAKDKTFNAEFKTEFDESLPKINIVPQEIGRVVLNLINNAFYAVNEKRGQAPEGFQPWVQVKTRRINNSVEISISDNGSGIPEKVIGKIFQPFFTTKPTGKGTGLGLSLAYDIVKVHNGHLKVESKEGEGTTFVIQLPV